MKTTRETKGIELDGYEEQFSLLPVLEVITKDEENFDRAGEIAAAIELARSAYEEGRTEPFRSFRMARDEAADLVEAVSTENGYLEYFIAYARVALQGFAKEPSQDTASLERTHLWLENACMDRSRREIAHMALDAMVEAVNDSAGQEALLAARPRAN